MTQTYGVPPALLEFQTSFRVPDGVPPAKLLGGFDEYTNGGAPSVGATHRAVPLREVNGWRLTVDITAPDADGPFPVLVYLHGGGWSMGSPFTHRRLTAELTALGLLVASVDYRRAPKHRFPAAVEDAAFALDWAREHAAEYGGDPDRLVIGGDSAGANLAAGVLAAGGGAGVRAALLCYGVFDYHRMLSGLGRVLLGGSDPARQLYLPPDEFDRLRDDPRLSPESHVAGFPPSLLTVGALDPLLPESKAMAARLGEASVPHRLHIAEAAPHGYLQLPTHPAHDEGLGVIAHFLRELI